MLWDGATCLEAQLSGPVLTSVCARARVRARLIPLTAVLCECAVAGRSNDLGDKSEALTRRVR